MVFSSASRRQRNTDGQSEALECGLGSIDVRACVFLVFIGNFLENLLGSGAINMESSL
jgi:hypothetical protein